MTTIPATVAALATLSKSLPTDRRSLATVLLDSRRGATVATNGQWLIALRTPYADADATQLHPLHVKAIANATPKRGKHETARAWLSREVATVADVAAPVDEQAVARTVTAGTAGCITTVGAPAEWADGAQAFPDYGCTTNVDLEKYTTGPCFNVDYLLALAQAAKSAGATAIRVDLCTDAERALTGPALLRLFHFSRSAYANEAHIGDAVIMPMRGDAASVPVVGSTDYVASITPAPAVDESETTDEADANIDAADDDVERFRLPTYWASALVNGDESGLDDDEVARIAAWVADHPGMHCVDVLDDSEFYVDGDDHGLPGDRSTFVFLRHATADAPNDYAAHVTIAADGVGSLRRSDVFRVMESAAPFMRAGLAEWLTAQRPDLADEVAASLADLNTETTESAAA